MRLEGGEEPLAELRDPEQVGDGVEHQSVAPEGGPPAPSPFGWPSATVYFALTDRFSNGDPANDPPNLPWPPIPLIIQDRMFDTNGQLFFPNVGINPEHPFWVPEFVGDTFVVNGKVWPYLNVDRQRYRFFIINGSNSRPYDMFLLDEVSGVKGPRMWVIATDGGYLDAPVPVQKLIMQPGERYEVIIDFAGLTGRNLILKNTGRTPFPKGAPPAGATAPIP